MFTGIIESLGVVSALAPKDTGAELSLEIPFAAELALGESVAVNGVCLTVAGALHGIARFDILAETLRATNLGKLQENDTVNLERAVRAADRMSGHVVQGHVDTTTEVLFYGKIGSDYRLDLALPEDFARYIAYKGSVAINGTSLTVADVSDPENRFTLWIIPHTHSVTSLHTIEEGDVVNLECDVLAKYLERLHEAPKPES